jgi:rhamnosyltransferase
MHGGVTAVIISFNGADHTGECADSLARQVDRVVIVDNGSDEPSRAQLRTSAEGKNWELIWLENNLGIAAALNVGLKAALRHGSRWMLTMDQDSIAAPDMLAAFSETIATAPTAVCVSAAVPSINPSTTGQTLRYAITSGNMVQTSVAAEVGGYCEELFIDGVDFDFSLRLNDAGHAIYCSLGAKLNHRLGDKISKIPFHTFHSPLRRYYIFRNYWVLMSRHSRNHPAFAARLTISHILQLVTIVGFGEQRLRSLRLIARGCLDAMRGRLGPYRSPR